MEIIPVLLAVILAGVINGSFALPTKYMKKWKEENIWFIFSFWGFLILPWLSMYIIDKNIFDIFSMIGTCTMWKMIIGGICFGIGQVCFAFALRMLGLGLAFVINIGLGTAGSALLPLILWHRETLGTSYSWTLLTGVLVFIIGIILGSFAGKQRDIANRLSDRKATELKNKDDRLDQVKKSGFKLAFGIIMGILAGIGSICQALTYIHVNPEVSSMAISHGASNLVAYAVSWLGIFSGAFIPYVIYFLILNIRNKSFRYLCTCHNKGTGHYWAFTLIMGLFFWMSLICFNKASEAIGGSLAPVIAWPMFMVFIILTSNFWGWKSGEWEKCGIKATVTMWSSIISLVIAVMIFAFSNSLK